MSVTYPEKWLCELAGVSRSGYYKWLNHRDSLNICGQQRQELHQLVADIHKRFPTFGYRFVADRIKRETGWVVCPKRVLSVMREAGIHSVVRRKRRNPGAEHKWYPNLLNRDFDAQWPLQKIVTDITYLHVRGKPYYLSAFLDLYNNEVLDYELGENNDLSIVMKPLRRILSRYKEDVHRRPFTLHSDQGQSIHISVLRGTLSIIQYFRLDVQSRHAA